MLPDPFLFPLIAIRSIGIFQKRQQTNGDKELRQSWLGWNWFFLFKLRRKLKLWVIMEDTNQLFLAVEPLFNIHIQFWVSSPSLFLQHSFSQLFFYLEWHCMANLRCTCWIDVMFCSRAWRVCWKSCLHFPEATCMW